MDLARHDRWGVMRQAVPSARFASSGNSCTIKLEARSTKHETNPNSPMTTMSTSEGAKGQRGRGAEGTAYLRRSAGESRRDCVWSIGIPDLRLVSPVLSAVEGDFGFRISDFVARGGLLAAGEGVAPWW